MRQRLRHLLPELSFLRKLFMLAGGTVVGQSLLILSSPLLTRFFTPAEFGLFAIFAAFAGIAGIASGLRFEFAIPIVPSDEAAAALVKLTATCTVATALGLMLAVWWLGPWLAALVDAPSLGLWLWLLPPTMLIWGLGSALTYWSVRRGRFAVNGMAYTLQFGSQAGSQLLFGLLGTGGPGLIVGYVLGYLARTVHHAWNLARAEWRLIIAQPWSSAWRIGCHNWRYPAFALPSQLLESACQLAPVILVGALYGPATAGWYALGQRIMGLPVRVLAEAASQVFLGELRGLEGPALRRLFLRTLLLFAALGFIGMLPVLFFAPPLFALVFGDPWRETGVIVQLLVPLFLARFVVTPTSQLLYYLNNSAIVLLSSILNIIAMIGSFSFSYAFSLSINDAILLFSLTSTLSSLVYLGFTWVSAHDEQLRVVRGGADS